MSRKSSVAQRFPLPGVSSPKRGRHERQGIHTWLPYYAGYSAAFVQDMIAQLGLAPDARVLDPMDGSGTTTLVTQQQGLLGVGVELNPAAVLLAQAKDASLPRFPIIEDLLRRVVAEAQADHYDHIPHSDALKWIPLSTLTTLKRIQRAITAMPVPAIPTHPDLALLFKDTDSKDGYASLRCFL